MTRRYLLPDECNRPSRAITVSKIVAALSTMLAFGTLLGYCAARWLDVTMGGY